MESDRDLSLAVLDDGVGSAARDAADDACLSLGRDVLAEVLGGRDTETEEVSTDTGNMGRGH